MASLTGNVAMIDAQLQDDKAKLYALKNMLNKSSKLTDDMKGSLSEFDDRLTSLKKKIMPIYEEMQIKIRAQSNGEAVISELNKVDRYYRLREDLEKTIQNDIASNIPEYIKNMKELYKAIIFFKNNNPASKEVRNIMELFEVGLNNMCREFEDLLKKKTKSLSNSEIPHDSYSPLILELLIPDAKQKLALISKWIEDTHSFVTANFTSKKSYREEICNNYVNVRKRYLQDKLNNLANSDDASFSSTPLLTKRYPRNAEITRKGSKLSRDNVRRHSKRGHKRTPSDHTVMQSVIKEDLNIEKTARNFSKLTLYFTTLIRSEYHQIHDLIPESHRQLVFSRVLEAAMVRYESDGNTLVTGAQEQITRNNWVAVFPLIQLYQNITKITTDMESSDGVALSFESTPLQPISTIRSSISRVVRETLLNFKCFVEDDVIKHSNVASDGTVHQLTSNVMSICETLLQYEDTVGNLIQNIEHKGSRQLIPNLKRIMANYINSIIKALERNLESKSKVYENKCLSALFLINNYNYMRNNLRDSKILTLLNDSFTSDTDLESKYIDWIDKQMVTYRSWYKPILDVMNDSGHGTVFKESEKLKDSLKDVIKTKFKVFNSTLEEQLSVQKKWAIPDSKLRQWVRNDNIDAIVEKYGEKMYRKYEKVNFSSNNKKYIIHSPEDVEKTLNLFFDQKF